jgi:hypothetical protein
MCATEVIFEERGSLPDEAGILFKISFLLPKLIDNSH